MNNKDSKLILSRDYSRRESLQLLGLGTASLLIAPSWVQAVGSTICTLAPELTVGPYYVAREKIRSNISENKSGIPLLLRITVLDAMTCKPIRNAAVDIWHCDARGYYSGYVANDPDTEVGFGGPSGPGGSGRPPNGGPAGERPEGPPPGMGGGPGGEMQFSPPSDEQTFFRGVQFSNQRGVVEFTSIYPGWYYGRATHIHLKVHSDSKVDKEILSGGHVCHVGQLAFPDDLGDLISTQTAYAGRKLVRTRNDEDSVFTAESATLGMVRLKQRSRDLTRGFIGEVALTVDPRITPSAAPPTNGRQPGRNT